MNVHLGPIELGNEVCMLIFWWFESFCSQRWVQNLFPTIPPPPDLVFHHSCLQYIYIYIYMSNSFQGMDDHPETVEYVCQLERQVDRVRVWVYVRQGICPSLFIIQYDLMRWMDRYYHDRMAGQVCIQVWHHIFSCQHFQTRMESLLEKYADLHVCPTKIRLWSKHCVPKIASSRYICLFSFSVYAEPIVLL